MLSRHSYYTSLSYDTSSIMSMYEYLTLSFNNCGYKSKGRDIYAKLSSHLDKVVCK